MHKIGLDFILSVIAFVVIAVLFGVFLVVRDKWIYSPFILVINLVIAGVWLTIHTPD